MASLCTAFGHLHSKKTNESKKLAMIIEQWSMSIDEAITTSIVGVDG